MNNRRRLHLEQLESRIALTSNVTVTVTDGILRIIGDNQHNNIEIRQLDPVQPQQTPWPGFRYRIDAMDRDKFTQVNGKQHVTVNEINKGIEIDLADGSDQLKITRYRREGATNARRANLPADVSIKMGGGRDLAILEVISKKNLSVDMGMGEDNLIMHGSTVNVLNVATGGVTGTNLRDPDSFSALGIVANGLITVTGSDERDGIGISGAINRGVQISTGKGNDTIGVGGSLTASLRGQSSIDAGDGNDYLIFSYRLEGVVSVNMGTGADRLSTSDTSSYSDLRVNMGTDNDEVFASGNLNNTSFDGALGQDTFTTSGASPPMFGDAEIVSFEVMREG